MKKVYRRKKIKHTQIKKGGDKEKVSDIAAKAK